jgi:hypothetical protein
LTGGFTREHGNAGTFDAALREGARHAGQIQQRFQKLFDESRVQGDGADSKGRPDLPEHLCLGNGDNTGVREEEFAVGERMREGIAQHDGRPQIGPAFKLNFARAGAKGGGDVARAGRGQTFFNAAAN